MKTERAILPAFFATLAIFVLGGFVTGGRFWGINWWSYFPIWIWLTAAGALGVLPLFLNRILLKSADETTTGKYWGVSLISTAAIVALFVVFANRTHFLGDGLQILHNVKTGAITHMIWNLPAEWIQARAFSMVGGNSEESARLAVQLIAWASGLLALLALLVGARRLGAGLLDSWLFVIGVLSTATGYFFFGYVETYPPFIFAILTVSLCAILATQGLGSRWWVLIAWIAAMAFHPFAIAIFPAVVYLILQPTRLWQRVAKWPKIARYGLLGAGVAAGIAVIAYLATHSYQIRFMLVPPVADRFTVEGYTLFSMPHLLDLINLVIFLVPSVILVLAGIRGGKPEPRQRTAAVFIFTATAGAAALVFLFDPKLGMLRDWDLFAFAAIPAIVYGFYYLIFVSTDRTIGRKVALLAIALNLAVLVPRVAVAMSPERSIDMVDRIFKMDKNKSRSLHYLTIEYLRDHGEKAKGDSLQNALTRDYPELKIMEHAVRVYNEGNIPEAIGLADLARSENPSAVDAYSLLCASYSALGRLPEALEIAHVAFGLNPHNADISYNMANIYARLGKTTESREYIDKSIEIQPDHQPSMYAMATLAVAARDRAELHKWMERLPIKDSVDASKYRDLIYSACVRSMFDDAADLIKFGMAHKLDTAVTNEIFQRYPNVRSRLN